jgi:olefin beta-lactone synthetase
VLQSTNFAELVRRHAVLGDHPALVIPTTWQDGEVTAFESIGFADLIERIDRFAAGFQRAGFKPGHRVVVLTPVSVDLYALVLGAFTAGLAVVLIDTGMGFRPALKALRSAEPRAIVAVKALLKHRWWIRQLWGLEAFATDGAGFGYRAHTELLADAPIAEALPRGADDHALITYTSGSTGAPKGADRTHGLLSAQHEALRRAFPDRPDDIDMTCFPVVALHNLCCGITTVLPPVDLADPAAAEGALVWRFAVDHSVTRLAGAPAFIERLTEAARAGAVLPALRGVAVGGAPVDRALCHQLVTTLPQAERLIVYGSTEAEPMCHIEMSEVLEAEGDGLLVGTPVIDAEIVVVALPALPPKLSDRGMAPFACAPGASGEIVVAGAHVNAHYLNNPAADAENKLYQPDGKVWHRTGDVGHFDGQGRLWLTGRRADLVQVNGRVIHPLAIEAKLNTVPGVRRCALIEDRYGVRWVIEGAPEAADPWAERLNQIDPELAALEHLWQTLPMDRRHRSKIDRVALRR